MVGVELVRHAEQQPPPEWRESAATGAAARAW